MSRVLEWLPWIQIFTFEIHQNYELVISLDGLNILQGPVDDLMEILAVIHSVTN